MKNANSKLAVNMERFRALLGKPLNGAQAAEVYAGSGESFEIGLLNGEIDTYDTSRSRGVSLRVDCGQIGYAYSEAPGQDPERLLNAAVENAACVESEDAPFMRFYEGAQSYPDLGADEDVDERLLQTAAQEKIARVRELERIAQIQDKRISRLEHCALSTGISETMLFNSLGLSLSRRSGLAIAYCSPVAESGGEVKSGFAYDAARNIDGLDLYKIAREAAEDATSQFGAASLPSGTYDVLLKSTEAASLIGAFMGMFCADAAQKGLSLLAGKEGERIGSEAVQIADDPLHPLSLRRHAFDDEGVAASRTELVRGGVLASLLHNRKTAAKAGCATTGNAGKGSVSAPVGVVPSNFVLLPGERSCDELRAQMNNGVYVTSLSGLHAGVNAVSGTFSLLCRGHVVRNGQIEKPVEQITIVGNFLEMLTRVVAVGSDLRFGLSQIGAPCVLLEGMRIAGQ